MNKKFILISLVLTFILSLAGCGQSTLPGEETADLIEAGTEIQDSNIIDKNEEYTSPEDVALYIHTYGELPSNYISKSEAMDLGWDSSSGNLWEVTDNKCIGGDIFKNREGLLPMVDGRVYYECDVNYKGGYRGPERIVYSNDGLIFYTDDHYESFEQLY